jgi:DNA-binding NarL/FixJ family response regulator
MAKKARLIIVDDHQVVRQGLRNLVESEPGLVIVAEAGDGETAEDLAGSVAADLMILDVALPGKSGIDVLEGMRTRASKLPVLVFSMYSASQYASHSRRLGARGYVSKTQTSAQLLRAIRKVLAGGEHFPADADAEADRSHVLRAGLSPREIEVMHGLLRGEALGTIAIRLGITPKTVSTYRRRLLDKLDVQSNVELAALASRLGDN